MNPGEAFLARLDDGTEDRLRRRLDEVNRHIRTKGIREFAAAQNGNFSYGIQELLTGYAYQEFYDWDLYFECLYLSYYGVSRYCRNNVEAFLDRQLEDGFVARTLINPRQRQHFKPFLAQTALLGCRQTGNYLWLKDKYYRRLKKYLDYWFWYCDFDKNGLAVWDSADASGMDNQDLRAGKLNARIIEGVDLNSYLYRELQAMAILASELGLPEEERAYRDHSSRLKDLINAVFWDEEAGFYFDRNERTGARVKIKSIAGFLPLWAGVAPKNRAERLVTEHLTNPNEFWLPHPIACWSKDEPGYYQQRKSDECNWMGTCWVPTNYMVFQGLRSYGYLDLANELAERTFAMVLSEETTREYYNAETGCGQGLNPFWGWSTLAYFLPLEFEYEYNPTDLNLKTLRPLAGEVFGLRFPV